MSPMSQFEKNINADYLRRSGDALQGLKQLSYSLMNLPEAERVLDVGCGVGLDLAPMLARMRGDGVVTGLDLSEKMLAEAARLVMEQGLEERIELVRASAMKLPFASGYFDAVRAERLFQVISPEQCPPRELLGELLRVVRPGGRIVLADTDWASASLDFPDIELERRMMDFFARRCRPSGFAARQFRAWLLDEGLHEVEIHILPQPMFSMENCPLCAWLADEALRQGLVGEREARLWMGHISERSAAGSFYACANMLVVAGTLVR